MRAALSASTVNALCLLLLLTTPVHCHTPELATLEQVQADLHGRYSEILYGFARSVHLQWIRVLWPALLASESRSSLHGAVQCEGVPKRSFNETQLFIQPSQNFLNAGAVWVHQPAARLPRPPLEGEWAEVSHCSYWNPYEHIHPETPMWFFHAPGSGLWLNVGRTLHLGRETAGVDETIISRFHKALILGFAHRIEPLLNALRNQSGTAVEVLPLSGYDSMQFPLYGVSKSWGEQRFTEIVMLKWGREMHLVADHLTHFRCGHPPKLRACRSDDAAVRMHTRDCALSMRHNTTARQVLDWYNCSGSKAWGRLDLNMSTSEYSS